MNIVSVCGSLSGTSANRSALTHGAHHVEKTAAVAVLDVLLGDIPMFDPRRAETPPDAVVALDQALQMADAVLIAAPEYAGGLAGGTKNALDWLVGLASLYHKPTAVLSVGTTGGEFAIEQLVRTLSWQGALVVDTLGISAPRTKINEVGVVVDESTALAIERWADRLVLAVSCSGDELLKLVDAVVSPYGIDTRRFGEIS